MPGLFRKYATLRDAGHHLQQVQIELENARKRHKEENNAQSKNALDLAAKRLRFHEAVFNYKSDPTEENRRAICANI